MKKQELAIKYSNWTVAFFWTFIVLFVLITVGGMVYSYTNLIQLAFKLSYTDNVVKANFWPIFTELTMVCLSVLLLVIRFNKWPKLSLFKCLFYIFALVVIVANAYNTSVTNGFTLNSSVDLAIQELPVICYLVFLEIALYVVTNVISDKIKVDSKPHLTTVNSDRIKEWADKEAIIESPNESVEQLEDIELSDQKVKNAFAEQRNKNKLSKIEAKKQLLEVFKKQPTISQNAAGRTIGITQATASNYVRELKQSGELAKKDDKWIVYEW